MYCPNCGLDEKVPTQFCRSCGINLRPTGAAERPDAVAAAGAAAREEIGRAVAGKIRELSTAKDLKRVTRRVLPKIEKFLETPEERRLRRMRAGTISAAVGFGIAVAFFLVAVAANAPGVLVLTAIGAVTFLIGIAMILNGYFYSGTKKKISDETLAANVRHVLGEPIKPTSDLLQPMPAADPIRPFRSVTESTTTHLDQKDPR